MVGSSGTQGHTGAPSGPPVVDCSVAQRIWLQTDVSISLSVRDWCYGCSEWTVVSVGVTSSASSQNEEQAQASFHSVWIAICCDATSNLCRVASSFLSTNHQSDLPIIRAGLIFLLNKTDLWWRCWWRSKYPVTAETVVDLSDPKLSWPPFLLHVAWRVVVSAAQLDWQTEG